MRELATNVTQTNAENKNWIVEAKKHKNNNSTTTIIHNGVVRYGMFKELLTRFILTKKCKPK